MLCYPSFTSLARRKKVDEMTKRGDDVLLDAGLIRQEERHASFGRFNPLDSRWRDDEGYLVTSGAARFDLSLSTQQLRKKESIPSAPCGERSVIDSELVRTCVSGRNR